MEDSADIPRSVGSDSDPSGSPSGFKLSANLMARMEKLSNWRIDPSLIKFPEDPCEFRGGNATVSKAFLSSRSCDRFPEAAESRRDDPGEGGDKEKDGEHEHEPNGGREKVGHGRFPTPLKQPLSDFEPDLKCVAVKKPMIADNTVGRALGLALREAELLVGFSHPNVVKLEGFVEDVSNDTIWLVFPWVDNGNLKAFVASQAWVMPERVSLIHNVAQGLEYLHSQKPPICHGDLKSLNVLVNLKNLAVITDFGSARRLTEHDPNRQLEQVQSQPQPFQASFCPSSNTITLEGNNYTLRWAAPELLCDDQMTLWSDMWAFGWIVYEVMTNYIPFEDVPADVTVVKRVIEGNLPSITENAIQRLSSLMIMCWKSNPSERPTAEYCRKALDWIPKIVPDATGRGSDTTVSGIHSPQLLMRLGDIYHLHCDYKSALNFFNGARQICAEIGDEGGRADALWRLSKVHHLQSEYSEAFKVCSEILQIRTNLGDEQGRAEALSDLAEVYAVRSEYTEAIELHWKALQIHIDLSDRKRIAAALRGLAGVHKSREDYDEAIAFYSEALQIYIDIDDRRERAFTLLVLADVHWARTEYAEAFGLLSESLQIYTEIGDRNCRASVLDQLASKHLIRNEYSEAAALYSETLQLHTDLGDRSSRAHALSGLADVHEARREYSKAIELYSEALQIFTDLGNGRRRAQILCRLAHVHHRRNENGKATELYSEALQTNDTGDGKVRGLALTGLGEIHRVRNKYSEAIALCSEALQIYTDIGDSISRGNALMVLAMTHWNQDHYNDAASFFQQAAEIFEQIGQSDVAANMKKAADLQVKLALRSQKAT